MLINLLLLRLLSKKIPVSYMILYCVFFYLLPFTAFSHDTNAGFRKTVSSISPAISLQAEHLLPPATNVYHDVMYSGEKTVSIARRKKVYPERGR